MKSLFILSIVVTSFYGCSNGKIEERLNICNEKTHKHPEDSQSIYIVNESTSKKITFSVKEQENIQGKLSIAINQFTLFPGDELNLGCSKYIQDLTHVDRIASAYESSVMIYKSTGEIVDSNAIAKYKATGKEEDIDSTVRIREFSIVGELIVNSK